jgi:hypothetical protein
MHRLTAFSFAVLALWLAVDGSGASIDCVSRVPIGQTADEAETSSPPIGFMIGDSLLAVTYTPGQPVHVRLSWGASSCVTQFFLTAAPVYDSSITLGSWLVVSGPADESTCLSPLDSVSSSATLGGAGVVSAYWIAPASFNSVMVFQVTVVTCDGSFWIWESLLCQSTAGNSQNSIGNK